MSELIVLVDLESDPKPDWSRVPTDAWVRVFVGVGQRRNLAALANKLSKLVARSDQILTCGPGRNALDFHIASYLGEALKQNPRAHYLVLSKDKGYDPLLEHLRCRGLRCSRVSEASRIAAFHSIHSVSLTRQLWQLLHAVGPAKRPRSIVRLANLMKSKISKSLSDAQITAIVDQFVGAKVIDGTGKSLTYSF